MLRPLSPVTLLIATLAAADLLPNPSFETADPRDPARPQHWRGDRWGDNAATFRWLRTGYQSARSVQVTLRKRVSGDARWSYEPRPVEGGATYEFSDRYRATVPTRVVVTVTLKDGSTRYLRLGAAPASARWARYADRFTVPLAASRATVTHLIERDGELTVDELRLEAREPKGFRRPVVTLTFDDGRASNVTTVLPVLESHHLTSTQFCATGLLGRQGHLSLDDLRAFSRAGHEIGGHSVSHRDLTTLSGTELERELRDSKQLLERELGITVSSFASPYGLYDDRVLDVVRRHYGSHRGVETGYNPKDGWDAYRVKVQSVHLDTTIDEVREWLSTARRRKEWLILVYHKVDDEGLSEFDTRSEAFVSQMRAVAESGIHVATVRQAVAELSRQR
ncbi:MAG TPA: polysaccharide deacetylase family protein [Candidatus Eisenbacteria bacterium]|nr:polysaccharide deacetylase family protein [Candidatus Eisenbacteria bacterium]